MLDDFECILLAARLGRDAVLPWYGCCCCCCCSCCCIVPVMPSSPPRLDDGNGDGDELSCPASLRMLITLLVLERSARFWSIVVLAADAAISAVSPSVAAAADEVSRDARRLSLAASPAEPPSPRCDATWPISAGSLLLYVVPCCAVVGPDGDRAQSRPGRHLVRGRRDQQRRGAVRLLPCAMMTVNDALHADVETIDSRAEVFARKERADRAALSRHTHRHIEAQPSAVALT